MNNTGKRLLTLNVEDKTKTYLNFEKDRYSRGFQKNQGLIWENRKSTDHIERKKREKLLSLKETKFLENYPRGFSFVTFLMKVSIFFFNRLAKERPFVIWSPERLPYARLTLMSFSKYGLNIVEERIHLRPHILPPHRREGLLWQPYLNHNHKKVSG